MIAFGPVPSRRLGRSLGINNIPPKACTYSCVYCQLGRTSKMQVARQAFYDSSTVVWDVRDKIRETKEAGNCIDFLTFVSDGEPTLDLNLGEEIIALKSLDLPVAVITNGALIWRDDVREDLENADWVSLKVDAVREDVWRGVDRPHRSLWLASILDGMAAFAQAYRGTLVTETMLVEGVNDGAGQLSELANVLAQLDPACAYLAIPTRPPAEVWVRAPSEETVNQAYQNFCEKLKRVECLTGYEGNAFDFAGDVERDLLSITAVHPMRRDAVGAFLARAGEDWSVVRALVDQGQLVEVSYEGQDFYIRKLNRVKPAYE
jgi:wyosine [tRNA(Phe)-imidazoG37] synthetase (radical SAM superfamily)